MRKSFRSPARDCWPPAALRPIGRSPANRRSLRVLHAHKGVCRFVVSTTGVSAHAALPWLGDNAIYKAADVIEAIEQYATGVQQIEHPVLGLRTANLGIIAGGTTINTVPNRCVLKVDRRLLPGETSRLGVRAVPCGAGRPQVRSRGRPAALVCRSRLERSRIASLPDRFCRPASRPAPKPFLGTADYATDACTLQAAGIPDSRLRSRRYHPSPHRRRKHRHRGDFPGETHPDALLFQ